MSEEIILTEQELDNLKWRQNKIGELTGDLAIHKNDMEVYKGSLLTKYKLDTSKNYRITSDGKVSIDEVPFKETK